MLFTLTKSLFTAGLQCPKLLWWKVHEPDAVELQPDKVLQDRFDQGAQVGALARQLFDGGILIDSREAVPSRVAKTQAALAEGVPVFEGTFTADGIRINADILVPAGPVWHLIEVKSSSSLKDEHLQDAAVQAWVLGQNGIGVTRVEIMHLDKEFLHPDQGNLLTRADVTGEIGGYLVDIPDQIERLLKVLEGPAPEKEIGLHCDEPYACPFKERCWPKRRDHISRLHSVGPKKVVKHHSQVQLPAVQGIMSSHLEHAANCFPRDVPPYRDIRCLNKSALGLARVTHC